jgi:sugar phosphate isomerase/epimerase
MTIDRRHLLTGLIAASAAQAQKPVPAPPEQPPRSAQSKPWRPKLGIYCRYSPANLEFASKEGFTCIQLSTGPAFSPDLKPAQMDEVKANIRKSGLTVVALLLSGNHLDPNSTARARFQDRFARTLELAGELKVPSVATSSGAVPGDPFEKQVSQVVAAYEQKYFPVCEKHKVRILWEPHVNPFNIATGPVGFSALLKGFRDSPHVGIQLDPSHLAWQMIDPAQCVREFAGKIHNVHLKDTEILQHVLRRAGIQPLDGSRWWRFRLPGSGVIDWKAFFTALADTGYEGGMNIENEDQFTYPSYEGENFTESFKSGYRTAHAFVRQLVAYM